MEKITSVNVGTYVVNGTWITNGAMKPDKDSTESKRFTLKVHFKDVPVLDIINKALEPTKIQWVNGPGRGKYNTWKDNQTVEVDFKAPGRAPAVDPEVAMRAKLAGMTREERKEYLEALMEEVK